MRVGPYNFIPSVNPFSSLGGNLGNLSTAELGVVGNQAAMVGEVVTGRGDPNATLLSSFQNNAVIGLMHNFISYAIQSFKSFLQMLKESQSLATRQN